VKTLRVFDLLGKRALITRESAGVVGHELGGAVNENEVVLDFVGVEAVTPSFIDELLGIVLRVLRKRGRGGFRVVFFNPPMRLSSKFGAVARARQLEITESDDGSWVIEASISPGVR